MTEGPWDHRMKDRGLYELRFNGDPQAEIMWTKEPRLAATLVREMCDGLNAGYQARHPNTAPPAAPATPPPQTPAAMVGNVDMTPAAWREVLNTPEAAAAWAAVHAVDKRTYQNGAGLAHQAYLDEVTNRPDIDRDGNRSAA